QFNGNISGMRWKTAGDGEERAFGFKYDAANRLLKADFARNTGSWTRDNIINFDVQMGDGNTAASAYDENGNIKAMTQYGMKGPSTSGLLDLLTYRYKQTNEASNQLLAVTEDISINTTDNKLGDFTDKNRTPDDYDYDPNGNLKYDNNKKITSIEYNHLNLPWKITVKNDDGTSKGTIIYIYDASGNKLEKRTNELASSYNSNTAKQTATAYTGGFVYENNKLQFFGHEEGRVRFKQFIDGSNQPQTTYVFDYFLKDHLGNTRMVLTEEQQTDIYQAGMETTNRNFEVALFGNKINTTAQTPKPSGFDVDGANQVVSRVNGTSAENRVGPGVLLKVMAGDKFNAKTQAWYLPTAMDNTTDNSLQNIVANLLGQLTPSVIAAGKGSTAINATNTILQPGVENLLNSQAPASGAPKAYLNWILLDEKTFTSVANGFVPIPVITDTMSKQLLQVNNGNDVSITKNGYLYVYVSNESKGNVYFDDIRIEHKRGAMLEETHYYPFGLTMIGISSKAAGKLSNDLKYNRKEEQTKEFSDGSGLEEYDYGARHYNAQIGRWQVIDPLAEKYFSETGYNYVLNNPVNFIDKDGMDVYLMKPDGSVILAKKEDKTDIMYAVDNRNGIKDSNKDKKIDEKDGVKVDTKGLLDQLAHQRRGAKNVMYQAIAEQTKQHDNDLLKIFHFAANNVAIEFSLSYFSYKGKDWGSLQTYHKQNTSPGVKALGLKDSDIKKFYHNHTVNIVYGPNWSERNSMGDNNGVANPQGGDFIAAIREMRSYPDYVYFPQSTNLYIVTQKSIDLVQKINDEHKKSKR
ncbi:MAG: RHS repeat-associated core domain-containing protein, partial [Ferruginibacter sp.]